MISYELQICCGSREEFNPEAHVSLDLELALTNDNDAIKKELRRIGMAALADKKQFKNNTPWSVVTHQDKNAAIGGKLSMYLNNIDRISRRKGTVGELGEQAAGALWNLAANGDKGEIAAAGAIPALVACVEGGQACTPTLQHFAAAGLSSLAAGNADNRVAIAKAHAIPPLVALVGTGTLEQRQAATRALNNLSVGNRDNRAAIAKMGGVSLLVKQLSASDSTPALKEETAAALASLCAGNEANKTAVAAAGAIPILVDLVKGGETAPVKARAVAALRVLASKAEYRMAIAQAGLIPLLIEFLRSGTASQRHAAAGALWNLAFDNVSNATAIAKDGGIPPLVELTRTSQTQAQWEEAVGALESLNCSPANARLLKAHGWPPP